MVFGLYYVGCVVGLVIWCCCGLWWADCGFVAYFVTPFVLGLGDLLL